MSDFDHTELAALRSELLLRIAIQNGALVLLAPMLLVATWIALEHAHRAEFIYLVYAIAVGILALNWCHHGVRTAQIKRYLVVIEQRHASQSGWESWLPANRIGGLLGSRWLISTKGVFIGSQVAGAGGGLLLSEHAMVSPLFLISVLAIIVTGALLFTNPEE